MKGVLLLNLLALLALGVCQSFDELAYTYAPFLRFHKTQGDPYYCFPHDAADYYDLRKSGNMTLQCNLNYSSVQEGQIPTYWHAQVCGYHLHIAYWSFYGYNDNCDIFGGSRHAYWESLVIKIRDYDIDPRLHEVRFGQKGGWYTRIPGHYQMYEESSHPVAYVGKTHHGFYHDDGGTNSCCYYEDTRNPGYPDQHMMTWLNLVKFQNDTEDWMMDPDPSVWNGILVPTMRPDYDLCDLYGCEGSTLQICGTCGCHKSDLPYDEPF